MYIEALVADEMASKNKRKAAKSATKSYIDQMNELTLSEGVKNQEEGKEYIENATMSNVTVRKGNNQY